MENNNLNDQSGISAFPESKEELPQFGLGQPMTPGLFAKR